MHAHHTLAAAILLRQRAASNRCTAYAALPQGDHATAACAVLVGNLDNPPCQCNLLLCT
jgi:hypothetical protein